MANPKITADVNVNNRDAVKGFDETADAAEEMSGRVKRSSDELGESVDKLDGKAGAAERGFRGFTDGLNGTSDVMGGLQSGNLVQLGMGLADLAGAVGDLVLPLFQQMAVKLGLVTTATEGQTVAQEASNVAMAANPIGIVVLALAALAAAFYVAWTKSETFRDIVTGALDAVKVAFDTVVTFFEEHWRIMLAVLTGGLSEAVIIIMRHWEDIREGASKAFHLINDVAGPILDGIRAAFDFVRAGVDFVIDSINRLIGVIKGPLSAVSGVVHGIGGAVGGTIGRVFADGGIVPGAPGEAVGIVAHAGEMVLNQRQQAALFNGMGGAGGSTTIYYPSGYNPRELNDSQRRWQRINGGPGAPT